MAIAKPVLSAGNVLFTEFVTNSQGDLIDPDTGTPTVNVLQGAVTILSAQPTTRSGMGIYKYTLSLAGQPAAVYTVTFNWTVNGLGFSESKTFKN